MDRCGSSEGTQRRTKETTEPCPATKGRPGADRLSALPEKLLLHILSSLDIQEAVSTCCLSRRWRYLYRYLSSLDFYRVGCYKPPFPHPPPWFIDRVLLLHAAPRIDRFCPFIDVKIGEGCFAFRQLYRQLDSWLLFAVRRGVRVLDLVVNRVHANENDDFMPAETTYGVPPWVFHCGTLENFSVYDCHLCLPSHVRLVSLKKMKFKWTELGSDSLKCLLRGCPLLQSLKLLNCNEDTDLLIDARENRNLEELVIYDGPNESEITQMQIYAPSVKYLTFRTSTLRRQNAVMDLSSVVVASFELEMSRGLYGNEVDVFTTDLMLRIHQVQVLKLCRLSLEALSKRELRGSLVSALPGVTTLELTVRLEGPKDILSALHACSKLRTLVLRITAYVGGPDEETGSPRLHALDVALQDLKTVVIRGLKGSSGVAGSLAREKKKNCVIVWMGFLLRVSPALEELTVQPSGQWESLSESDRLSLPAAASPIANLIMMDEEEVKHMHRC